ncbi:hypothetical protein VB691_23365, partial [Crocosphaera sp. XPORK-15E]|nr:hypothetical protein [Crocosphaera sp. XPORK-15E]
LNFEVTLNSYGEGNTRELIATTSQGISFKIEKSHFLADKDLKEKDFKGETVKLTLSLETPQKKAMIANIKQADGSLLPIGEFTTNQKASKEALNKVGLFKDGATFEAQITSRVTAARINIDSNTIEYPEFGQWQQSANQEKKKLAPSVNYLIEAITTQPPILHQFDQDWQLPNGNIEVVPTLGLTVDMKQVEATKNFLNNQDIPYVLLSPDDAKIKLETERGYGVFWMVESDVPTATRNLIEQRTNGVYNNNLSEISSVSPYQVKLTSIPPLSEKQRQERLDKNQGAFSQTIRSTEVPQLQQKSRREEQSSQLKKPSDSYKLVPKSSNTAVEKNRVKDRDMASVATQFNTVKIDKNLDDNIDHNLSDSLSSNTESPKPTYLSINNISSDPEFDINHLMEQQQRTELVAPIALEYLKLQDPQTSDTRHFKGPHLTFDYDGHYLTIKDNKDDSIKMKARFTGVEPVTKKTQWLSALPENSPGLTQADVNKWTSDSVKEYIKQEKIKQATTKGLAMNR